MYNCVCVAGQQRADDEDVDARPNPVAQRGPRRVAGVRGRPPRNRLAAGAQAHEEDSGEWWPVM